MTPDSELRKICEEIVACNGYYDHIGQYENSRVVARALLERLSQPEDPRIAEIEKRHQFDQSLCVTSFDELLALARERHTDRATLLSIVRGKA